MNRKTRALSPLEERSWQRIGRVLVPGNSALPRYDYSNVVKHVPSILAASHQADEETLRVVAMLLGMLPLVLIKALLTLLNHWAYGIGWAGNLPRQLMIGIKGVIYTSYYSGLDATNQVHQGMAFELKCEPVAELLQQQIPLLTELKDIANEEPQ